MKKILKIKTDGYPTRLIEYKVMPDGSHRRHDVFPSHKVSDTEIVLDGLNYELVDINRNPSCKGCAFDYEGSYECIRSETLSGCGYCGVWRIKE